MVENKNNIYPSPSESPKLKNEPSPDFAFQQALHKSASDQSVASRIPNLGKYAALLLVFTMIGPLQILIAGYLNSSYGNTSQSAWQQLIEALGVFNIVLNILLITTTMVILTSRKPRLVKWCLVAVGLSVLYSLVLDIIHFSVIGVVISGVILWFTYNFYESITTLEI